MKRGTKEDEKTGQKEMKKVTKQDEKGDKRR